METKITNYKMRNVDYLLLFGMLAMHLILLVSLKFTAWPEMSLWPYLITKGWLPYSNIAVAHTPLMLFDIAVFFKIFGIGIMQLKMFTWSLILFADILVFTFAKRLWNKKTAFIALAAFAILNLFFDGNGLWFDLYMGVLAFCSFYFVRKRKWFWGGFFWALAFISKQTAVWFLLPILLEMVKNLQEHYKSKQNIHYRLSIKKILKFSGGVIAVAIPFTAALTLFGTLPDFWNWAVKFGVLILPKAQGQIQLPAIKTLIIAVFPYLVFVPLLAKRKSKNINLFFWALAGGFGAYPRFEYFHLQPAIYFIAIAAALMIGDFGGMKKIFKTILIVYFAAWIYLFSGFFMRNFHEGVRFYENNVQDVVMFVRYNTKENDRIFVLNWWDNVYALSGTLPSTNPWVPQLSWYTEMRGVQEKMVKDLEDNPPKLIVFNPYTEFGLSSYIPQKIYTYITDNYIIGQNIDGIEILVHK